MKARPLLNKLLLPALLISGSSLLEAASLTWNGTAGGNWDTAATNWLDGDTPTVWSNLNPDSAIFGETGAGTVNLTTGITAASLTFNHTGYSIGGGSLTLSGDTPTITTGEGVIATIHSGLSGTAGMTKTGAGKLTLGSAPGYSGTTTINDGTLQFGYTAAFAGNVAINSPGTLILTSTAQIVGSSLFTLSGDGALVIGGTNNTRMILQGTGSTTYTGDITVQAGSIFEARSFFSSTTGNSVTVESGGELRIQFEATSINALNGAGLVQSVSGAQTLTIGKSGGSGNFSGIMRNNGSVLSLTKSGAGIQTLSGANTYTGATNINGGTLKAGADNTFSANSAIILANTSGVSLDLDGFNQTVGSIAGGGITGGNIALGSGTLTSGGNNSSTTFAGVISGTGGALVKTGTGTLTLSGTNIYDGGTMISKGGLQLNNASAAGSGAITLNDANTDAANTTLTLATGIYANAITVANQGAGVSTISTLATTGTIAFNGGIALNKNTTFSTPGLSSWLTLESTGTLFSGTGTLTINSASASNFAVILNSGSSTNFTGDVVVNGNAKLEARNLLNPDGIAKTAGNNMRVDGWLYLSGGANSTTVNALTGSGNIGTRWNGQSVLTVGQGGGSGDFSGVIQNGTPITSQTTALTKVGTGIQTLSGANTYTGATAVNGGTLLVNGSTHVSSTFTVGASGTLGGTGTIGGGVNVSGVLSPGASIESLATGALTMNLGSTFAYEVGADHSADLLVVNGTLSLTGTNLGLDSATQLNLALDNWSFGDKLTLISYTGGAITGGFDGYADDTSYLFGSNEWFFNYDDLAPGLNYQDEATGNRFITMTLIPEPGTALLGSLGLLALLRRRR